MATLNSVFRSIAAASRRAERGAKRRQRELEDERKLNKKMQDQEQAAFEVSVFENAIEVMQSLHKECSESLDWDTVADLIAPVEPEITNSNEATAIADEQLYKPGFIDRIMRRDERKREFLRHGIVIAQHKDKEINNSNKEAWQAEYDAWRQQVEMAKLLLQGDTEAVESAIEALNPFAEIADLGSEITVIIPENCSVAEVEVHVHGTEIIPVEMKTLLQSGRLSVKKMPKGRFFEIYQDYVCSCVLRVAREFFAIIPSELVVVTAVDELLNTKTGHIEKTAILSAYISRETLDSLNMDSIDPSDSMGNFTHNMSFKKTSGFQRVNRFKGPSKSKRSIE